MAARRVEIPQYLDPSLLARAIARRLGDPDFPRTPIDLKETIAPVIWSDGGDEVLVHLDSVRCVIRKDLLLVSVDLECDQTGRQTLVVPLALGSRRDQAGLVAVTEELPRGHGLLAGRWGGIVQEAVWSALLDIAKTYATRLKKLPFAFSANEGVLALRATPASELTLMRDAIVRVRQIVK
jgi:hypothetical protein